MISEAVSVWWTAIIFWIRSEIQRRSTSLNTAIFAVLTKIDLVDENQIEKVKEKVRED